MGFTLNATKFKGLQKKYNLNFSEIADKIGVSRTQLWRVLNKQCSPGEQFIAGFKSAFPNENFDEFFLLQVLQQSDTVKVV